MFRTGHKLHLLLIYDFYIWFPHLWWLFAQCWNRFCVYIEMCHIWWPRCMEAGASSKNFAWLWRSDVITFCVLLMGPNSLLNFVIGVTYCCWWDRVSNSYVFIQFISYYEWVCSLRGKIKSKVCLSINTHSAFIVICSCLEMIICCWNWRDAYRCLLCINCLRRK